MNKNIDKLLSQALAPDCKPGDLLNRRIINQAKEIKDMKYKMIRAAVIAAAFIAATSATAMAAAHFLRAKDVAAELKQRDAEAAFERTNTDSNIQTFEQGGYRFAFLGTASGVEIRDKMSDAKAGETYVIVAAERLDGTVIADDEEFVASVLIQSLDPFEYNVYSMGVGTVYKVIDGIYYMIMSCDNVEIFADRQMYVAVTTGPSYKQAYYFDEATGLISRNESFDGINALFEIELDAGKADKEAQEKYLADLGRKDASEPIPYAGDAGTAPMIEYACSQFENEEMNFALSVDYNRLDEQELENIIAFGTVTEQERVTEIDGRTVDFLEDGKTVQQSMSANTERINMEFVHRDGDYIDRFICSYDLNQIKAVYRYFHEESH